MKDFLKRVFEGNGKLPSEMCVQSFSESFSDAVNVEWFSKKECNEAIFYRNNIEHIALFSLNGILLEYKQNLPIEFLPEQIKNIAHSKGEIMNAVLKNKGNMLEYELIIRDRFHYRQLVVLTDMGDIKEVRAL